MKIFPKVGVPYLVMAALLLSADGYWLESPERMSIIFGGLVLVGIIISFALVMIMAGGRVARFSENLKELDDN
ncbi:MAG: hypothetical protein WC765_07180 [Phycisphaerae bacterium]|jgi:hypothetical protein